MCKLFTCTLTDTMLKKCLFCFQTFELAAAVSTIGLSNLECYFNIIYIQLNLFQLVAEANELKYKF